MPAKTVKKDKIDKVQSTNLFNQFISVLSGAGAWKPEKEKFVMQKVKALSQKFPGMTALFNLTTGTLTETEHASKAKEAGKKAEQNLSAGEKILKDMMYVKDEKGNTRMRTSKELKEMKVNPVSLAKEAGKYGEHYAQIQKNEQQLEKNAGLNVRGEQKLDMQKANLALNVIGKVGAEWDKQEKAKEKEAEVVDKAKKKKIKFIGDAIGEAIGGFGEGFQKGRHLRGY